MKPVLFGVRLVTMLLLLPLSMSRGDSKPPVPYPAPPSYKDLAAAHTYKSLARAGVSETRLPDTEFFIQRITFLNRKKETVPGIFVRPKAEGVYPVALILHGLGGSKEQSVSTFGRSLASHGIASLSLDAPRHGERAPKGDSGLFEKDGSLILSTFSDMMDKGIAEQRQALDYLSSRPDIDPHRIGLLGLSLGAMMGTIVAATDKRIEAVALCAGGDPMRPLLRQAQEDDAQTIETISPSNYIRYIEPRPVYLINGTGDTIMGDDNVKLLVDAAGPAKTVVSVPGAGHDLPPEDREMAVEWLAAQLQRPRSPQRTCKKSVDRKKAAGQGDFVRRPRRGCPR